MLKKEGVLDEAIVSQVGRKIILNVGKARAAARIVQQETRQDVRQRHLGR